MFKKFSTLLALRYLNPVRTNVSVITLISLAGVALGVMVLIVVSSVMDGFEDLIKSRVLGRAPHIVLDRDHATFQYETAQQEWRDQVEALKKEKKVTTAYPLVRDLVFIEFQGSYMQSEVKGMDTSNPEAVAEFSKLVKPGNGDADMGQGYVVTVSSEFVRQTGLGLGDTIGILTTRNIQQLQPLIGQRDYAPLTEQKGLELDEMIATISQHMVEYEEKEAMPNPLIAEIKSELRSWAGLEIRTAEREMTDDLIRILSTKDHEVDEEGLNFYPKGNRERAIAAIHEIKNLNVFKADSDAISEVALPKEVEIVAIYQTDIYAPGVQMIVPLSVAQEIAGINDTGIVTRLAVHVDDPYKVEQELEELISKGVINSKWIGTTWTKLHEKQFSLISSQKSMMVIALSFIVLIAVFSIGAVMFTITYQKKKEIGVMKALGATPFQITKVFTLQGVIVGFLGALIGWGLGLLVIEYLDEIQNGLATLGFNPFDKSFYGVEKMPVIISNMDIAVVLVGAFVLCTIAALVPAWIASRADAAKSLRNM